MKVLFLDDDDARHMVFQGNINEVGTVDTLARVFTYDVATQMLTDDEAYDVVYLDYDLNDHPSDYRSVVHSMYGDIKLTGAHVAVFIASLPKEQQPKRVVIHSWNLDGKVEIQKILEAAGIPTTIKEFDDDTGKELADKEG